MTDPEETERFIDDLESEIADLRSELEAARERIKALEAHELRLRQGTQDRIDRAEAAEKALERTRNILASTLGEDLAGDLAGDEIPDLLAERGAPLR